MYKKHLKAWGLEKNLKTAESIAMLKIAERRRAANKDTRFTCRGRPVEPGKLRRFAKRHNLVVDGAANALSDQKGTSSPGLGSFHRIGTVTLTLASVDSTQHHVYHARAGPVQ
jgi:hypothetical protein